MRADISGDTTADLEILLKGVASVTGGDFVLKRQFLTPDRNAGRQDHESAIHSIRH
ncbi:hypothetical protein [Paracoccus sphaerophysae]|uniref:hypothetical protein n=1 Tax=Paracoccus sphaerophysae TaxID=690417 RepID=UPI0023553FC9|nr:hypothetical protein [Paracoccus sphaerophysae]